MVPPLNFRSSARDPPPPSTPASPRPRESVRERREDICREREGERERGRASEREEERERASERARRRDGERASERASEKKREGAEREGDFFCKLFFTFFFENLSSFLDSSWFWDWKKKNRKKSRVFYSFFSSKKKNRTRAVPSNTVL